MKSATPEKQPWKKYTLLVVEAMLTFYLATFCLIMYLFHSTFDDTISNIMIGLLYIFVLFVSIKRLINQLPIAVLMLLVPIAPLFALIVVVTMIPILQMLR